MHVKCLLALSLTHAMLSMLSDKVLEIFSIMAENTKGELKCAGLVTCVPFSLTFRFLMAESTTKQTSPGRVGSGVAAIPKGDVK